MISKNHSVYTVFSIAVCFFAIATWLGLSNVIRFDSSIPKYLTIILVFIITLVLKNKNKADHLSLLMLSVFIFMLSLFTIVNISHWNDIIILLGYFLCFFTYYMLSKSNFLIHYNLRNILFYLGIIFVILNLIFVFMPSAYSLGRGQFTGFFNNANAFTGLCGLFFVLNFSIFSTVENKIKKNICVLMMGVIAIYLILGSSRGAIISTFVASLFILLTSSKKKNIIFLFILLSVVMIFFKDSIFDNAPNRDIFEDTGRQNIFLSYWNELKERYFYIGTGVSLNAGRMKTELSYLDVLLMTGIIGFTGFIGFIFRTLYMSFFLRKNDSKWLIAVYIYIIIASIFEGYAANILSFKSLLFYVVPALIYSNFRNLNNLR